MSTFAQDDIFCIDSEERATARAGVVEDYIPTHRGEAGMDGAPERFWLMQENRQRQQQILRCAKDHN